VSEQLAKLKFAWSSAIDAADGDKHANAVLIMQKLADGGLLKNLLQARRDAAADSKPSGVFAQRKFMIERWARIPTELKVELQGLRKVLEQDGIDDSPAELTGAIDAHLQQLLGDLQSQLDTAINAGNMDVFKGLRQRVEQDSVIGHLLKAPFMDGSRFKKAALDAMDEIEEALTA
jgi:hypothetical protein